MTSHSTHGTDSIAHSQQYANMVSRLPITFQPFIRQELRDWPKLFSCERTNVENMLSYLNSLDGIQFGRTFARVRAAESAMGVASWNLSTDSQTIQNTAKLARSSHYEEWRGAVDEVFRTIQDKLPVKAGFAPAANVHRLVLILFPGHLPMDRANIWKEWTGTGREVALTRSREESSSSCSDVILGADANGMLQLLQSYTHKPGYDTEQLWFIDAASFDRLLPDCSYLSYLDLRALREMFLDKQNWVQDDLNDADAMIQSLRSVDIESLCPLALNGKLAAREFVREVFLSGNGATVYGNSFVEWSASEGIRRARPDVLIARFGLRNKPKPLMSVAVLENQQKVYALPDIEDPTGSALDSQILANYIWRAANRYDEYSNALCICVSDALSSAYIVAPEGHALLEEPAPIEVTRLHELLVDWLA